MTPLSGMQNTEGGDSVTTMTINNELSLCYPDGFHEMDADEMKRFFATSLYRRGIYDGDRHILISVAWTKPGPLNYLTDGKTILLRAESGMRSGLLNYRQTERFTAEIAGKKACGVRFSFTASDADVGQTGVMTVFRAGNKFYAVTFVAREEGFAESEAIYRGIAESFTLSGKS